MTEVREVRTSQGQARLHVDAARRPRAVLALGHGAGGGVEAADLAALAAALPARGVTVVRVEQPWRVAGRRVAVAPPRLDDAWLESAAAWPSGPLVVGGRSAGARVACRTAARVAALAVVALAFPLHPPGHPERSRGAELATGLPTLVVQGDRDAFGSPSDIPAEHGLTVVRAVGADHRFAVSPGGVLTRDEVLETIGTAVAGFVLDLVRGRVGNG